MNKILLALALLFLFGIAQGQKTFTTQVHFASGKSLLTIESREVLDTFLLKCASIPKIKFYIRGHTDSIGTDTFNTNLGLNRAKRVYDYFLEQGVLEKSMGYKAVGEYNPISDNGTPTGRATNRCVVIKAQYQYFYTDDNDFNPNFDIGATVMLPVQFEFNSWEIKEEAYPILNDMADTLKKYPNLQVEVGGFIAIGGKGSVEGVDLSEERAKAVYNYLISLGVTPERLSYKGFQGKRPAPCPGCDKDQQIRKNRRVEITIIDK